MVESMEKPEMSEMDEAMAGFREERSPMHESLEERAEENAEKIASFLSDVLSDENAKGVLGRGFNSLVSEGKLSGQDVAVLKGKLQNLSNNANVISKNGSNIYVDKGKLKQWIKSNLDEKQLNDFQMLASKMKEQGPR